MRGAPEVALAREIFKGLGIMVSADDVRQFVLSRFSRLSKLSHAIHDATPPSPAR